MVHHQRRSNVRVQAVLAAVPLEGLFVGRRRAGRWTLYRGRGLRDVEIEDETQLRERNTQPDCTSRWMTTVSVSGPPVAAAIELPPGVPPPVVPVQTSATVGPASAAAGNGVASRPPRQRIRILSKSMALLPLLAVAIGTEPKSILH